MTAVSVFLKVYCWDGFCL